MSGYALFFKIQYELHLANPSIGVSKERLKNAVAKGYIEDTEYKAITGEDYSE